MSTINIGLVVRANTRQAKSALRDLSDGSLSLGSAFGLATKAATGTALAVGTVAGISLKFASDFESSLAGVRKTVDGTDAEIAALGRQFRNLSKEIPINVNELNRIGEAAGQLGIKKENIVDFTEVMAKLGVTTNLTSDQAATALARLANITGMPQENFEQLGSTIVALGNNFATTEAEIVEFGLRIAGAGTQIGLSEGEILAFGTTLSSLGIKAEAGGTAISRVMIEIAQSVDKGGSKLNEFARVAGLSVSDFRRLFRQDAAEAVTVFIEGLGRLGTAGESIFSVLEDVEFQNQRTRDALLRAAGGGEILRRSLVEQKVAWVENNALSKEAEQRFETLKSQWQLFQNVVGDVAISIGLKLLPVFKDFVGIARGYVEKEGPMIAELFGVIFVRAINAAITALGVLGKAYNTVKLTTNALGAQVTKLTIGALEMQRKRVADNIERLEGMGEAVDGVTEALERDRIALAEIDAEIVQAEGTLSGFEDQFNEVRREASQFEGLIDSMQGTLSGWQERIRSAGEETEDKFSPAARKAAAASERLAAAAKKAAAKGTELSDTLRLTPLPEYRAQLNSTHDQELVRFVTTTTGLSEMQSSLFLKLDLTTEEVIRYGRWLDSTDPKLRALARSQLGLSEEVEETTGLLDGLRAGFDGVLEGLTGGNGFGGFMKNIGSGIAEGFGQLISGGIAGAIQAGIGLLQNAVGKLIDSLFTSREEARTERARKNFFSLGSISEGLAKSIAELSIQASEAGRQLPDTIASIVKLGDVLQETGIRDTTAFRTASEKAREGIERFNEGLITEEELVTSLSGAFPVLAANLDKAGATGVQIFRDVIDGAREAGVEIEAINGFVESMTSEGAAAVNRFAQSFLTMVEVVDEEGNKKLVESFDTLAGDKGSIQLMGQQFNLMAAEMQANGASVLEILDVFKPTLEAATAAGVDLGGQFGFLQGLATTLADDGIQRVVDRQQAVSDMMRTTNDLGLLTDETFQTFTRQAVTGFNELIDAGIKEQDALRLQVPILTQLRDAAANYGFKIDDGTQALIDQAEAQGALPPLIEPIESILTDMRDILQEIAGVFRDELPGNVSRFRDEAVDDIEKVGTALGDLGSIDLPGFRVGLAGSSDFGEGFAKGGLTPRLGGPFLAKVHANELIIPPQVTSLLLDAAQHRSTSAAAGLSVGQVVINNPTFTDPLSMRKQARQFLEQVGAQVAVRANMTGGS